MTTNDALSDALNGHFDLYDQRIAACPFQVVGQLIEQGPVHWSDRYGGHWVVVGRDEVLAVAEDWRTFTSEEGVVIGTAKPQKYVPVEYDPPRHRSWRRVMNPFFSPELSRGLEPKVAAFSDQLLDGFSGSKAIDVFEDYAKPINGYAVFELVLGLSPAEALPCREAANDAFFGDNEELRSAGRRRVEELAWQLFERRRSQPAAGGLLDTVRTATIDGEPVRDEEVVGAFQLVIVGASDTTMSSISSLILLLAQHPELRDRVVRDRTLLPVAFEEMLRLESPAAAVVRTAKEDVELGGQHIKAGDKLLLMWLAANHDPTLYPAPDTFDIDRPRTHHVAFGAGPHRCIGASVAKSVVTAAVDRFLDRYPGVQPAPDRPVTYRMGSSRGPGSAPVSLR